MLLLYVLRYCVKQACVSSNVHLIQIPFHIKKTDNSLLEYGQSYVYSDLPVFQMPSRDQSPALYLEFKKQVVICTVSKYFCSCVQLHIICVLYAFIYLCPSLNVHGHVHCMIALYGWMFECVPLCISTCVCLECKHICAFLGVCTTCFVTTSISLYIWDAFVPHKYASCILLLLAVEKMKQELFPVVDLNIKKHKRSKGLLR